MSCQALKRDGGILNGKGKEANLKNATHEETEAWSSSYLLKATNLVGNEARFLILTT